MLLWEVFDKKFCLNFLNFIQPFIAIAQCLGSTSSRRCRFFAEKIGDGEKMRLSEAKKSIGKTVYYSFGGKIYECIFSACILRADKNGYKYYQAELTEKSNSRSVMTANLKDVILDVKNYDGQLDTKRTRANAQKLQVVRSHT